MKFKTIAEAFNFYRTKPIKDLEERAQAINNEIDTDPNADIEALNIELKGIKEARENAEIRSAASLTSGSDLNLVTGRNYKKEEAKTFEGEDIAGTPEYRNAFYKTLLGRKLTANEQAAFNAVVEKRDDFMNSTEAAALIPTTTLNEVISKARTMGGLVAEARAFNMPTKIAIPIATPGSNASWHTEGAAVTTEEPSIASVTFDGNEIIKIFSISVKVKTMTISAFESYLAEELTACVMGTIDAALINGTGSGQGTGIETAITWTTSGTGQNAVEVANGSKITYANVAETVGLLKRGYSQGAKWGMNNKTLYNCFYGMVDSNKRPIFIADPKNESVGKILGFDVVIDDNIADNAAYLGNYAKYLGYNLPGGILLESSRESSFKSGLIDYRALAIADCKPLINEAFVKLYIANAISA
ncbi:MAG: phage major capsid protein [Lachnospiraceae bacterium]|nr:phage major capsid protein [Lachnospiraceae bacterium]